MKTGFSFFLLLTMTLASCRKEPGSPPVITVSAPVKGGLYQVGDTIQVEAVVEDDEAVSKLSCSLVNSMNVPVLPVISLKTGSRSVLVSFPYPVDNPEIPTGDYSLLIFASDGESDARAYVPLFIQEMPRKLKGIYVTTSGGTGQTSLFTLDSGLTAGIIQNFPGDFLSAAINTHQQRLYLSGHYSGHLQALNTENNSPAWSMPNLATGGSPYFTSLGIDRDLVLTGLADGTIRGYSPLQVQGFFTLTDAGSFPVFLFPQPEMNRLFVMEEFIFGGGRNLVTYSYPYGSVLSVWPTTLDLKAMFRKSSHEVYLLGNEAGSGKVYVYDLTQGMPFLRHSFTGNPLIDAVMPDESHLLISTSQGIYEYDNNSNNPWPLVTGKIFQSLAYDDAGYELYAATGNTVYIYGYQLHQLIPLQQPAFPDSVLSIDLLHNREVFK